MSTVLYAVLTYKLVSETRRLRQVQTDPKIEIVLKPHEPHIHFVNIYVRNIGSGPAYDISFDIEAEVSNVGADGLIKDFTKTNFFNTGLRYLGPSQEVVSYYSQMNENFDEKIRAVLLVCVEYKNANGSNFEESFRVDFSELKGLVRLGRPPLYKIAEHIESIKRDIHHISTGFMRINVNTFSENDREEERKELDERVNEYLDNNNEWWMAPKK